MDGLTPTDLLGVAQGAGLVVTAEGELLVVRGPRRAAKLARALLERKADVLPLVRANAELGRLVLHMAAELGWPEVMTVSGRAIGPGEADWRRVIGSPRLIEPYRGIVLAGLKGALARRQRGVPAGVSWSEWEADVTAVAEEAEGSA